MVLQIRRILRVSPVTFTIENLLLTVPQSIRQSPTKPCPQYDPFNIQIQVKNLEESIKVDQLKEALTDIFSEYGNIIDLVAKTNLKAKGQAFIVFEDTAAAERAIQEVQGFELFEKAMILDYAKTRSDATVRRGGTEEEFEQHKRRRLAEKGRVQQLWFPFRNLYKYNLK